jgi:hypothetical protein
MPTIFPENIRVPGTITRCPACDRHAPCRVCACRCGRIWACAGVAPDQPGRISTVPPGKHGGNIDNWRIGAGATMYYPVQVDGALFSVGDPHISQGDGESGRYRHRILTRRAVPDQRAPRFQLPLTAARNPDSWIVHGFNEDLNVAMREAALDMLRLLTEQRRLSKGRCLFAHERRGRLRRHAGRRPAPGRACAYSARDLSCG